MDFTHCFSCMQKLDRFSGRCPHCGNENIALARSQPSHALPCGTLLHEQFVIGCMLGQGGFGITYIGWDLKMEQRVCIKEYFPAGAAMRNAYRGKAVFWSSGENAAALKLGRESFFREARKAVRLRDLPTMVKVWDVFYENETAYLVMDYVEGVTLKNYLIKTKKPLNEKECIRLFSPVMRDLEEAHSRGIIHRDISPDNLMLRPDGTLVLLDIGAAKDITVGSGQSTSPVVKHGFSPEEQYVPDESIGPWTDVYSMCATMVYCITGQVLPTPFERLRGREIDLSAFTPNVAETLRAGLAVRHEERIQSMKELAARLCSSSQVNPSKWKCGFCGATNPDSASFCANCGKKRGKRKTTKQAAIILSSVLVVAGLVIWNLILQSKKTENEPAQNTVVVTAKPESTTKIVCVPVPATAAIPASPSNAPRSSKDSIISASVYNGDLSGFTQIPFFEASASSSLVADGTTFSPGNAIDNDDKRPWIEGVSGSGKGQYLLLSFDKTRSIDLLRIRPGFADVYEGNGRPKTVELAFSDGSSVIVEIPDLNMGTCFLFTRPVETSYVKLTMLDVYAGKKENDTCIAEVSAYASLY